MEAASSRELYGQFSFHLTGLTTIHGVRKSISEQRLKTISWQRRAISGKHSTMHKTLANAACGCFPVHQLSAHSITSSARASRSVGMESRSAFAVLRLITNSSLVGWW